MTNSIYLIGILSFFTLLPFLIAAGTCFIKFSIVFVIVRNALGLQQVPSNMTLNGIALILSLFVMAPIIERVIEYSNEHNVSFEEPSSMTDFINSGLGEYKAYLLKFSDRELIDFFEKIHTTRITDHIITGEDEDSYSIISLLPAYALSEIKSAFKIGFYIYLPFVVVDLVISCILLTLGMMMMSPVTISTPIKLILFVAMDGWTLLSKGLILQYIELAFTK